jgi:hypothetical protein
MTTMAQTMSHTPTHPSIISNWHGNFSRPWLSPVLYAWLSCLCILCVCIRRGKWRERYPVGLRWENAIHAFCEHLKCWGSGQELTELTPHHFRHRPGVCYTCHRKAVTLRFWNDLLSWLMPGWKARWSEHLVTYWL